MAIQQTISQSQLTDRRQGLIGKTPARTESEIGSTNSLLADTKTRRQTEYSNSQVRAADDVKTTHDVQPDLPLQGQLTSVDAVVTAVTSHSVHLDCLTQDGEIEIVLPLVTVPPEFHSYGRPVRIELATLHGYRGIQVVSRPVPHHVPDHEDEDIASWISSM